MPDAYRHTFHGQADPGIRISADHRCCDEDIGVLHRLHDLDCQRRRPVRNGGGFDEPAMGNGLNDIIL